jgi:hypothetical protein
MLEIEGWLKNTIPGIIVLGAIGSVIAIFIIRMCAAITHDIAPVPFRMHQQFRSRQAYILGFTASVMDKDDTSKPVVTFMIFHFACFTGYLVLFLALLMTFLYFITMVKSQFNIGALVSVIGVIVTIYFAYFEFEYMYRTYLFFWKNSVESAKEGARKRKQP